MGNADYIVAWPDVSGSSANWTLSHRVPAHSAHDMPELASSTAGSDTQAYFQLVPNLTTTDPSSPYGAVAFLRPLQPDSNYPTKSGVKTTLQSPQTSFIYASGSQNPGSASPGASFAQHDQVSLFFRSSGAHFRNDSSSLLVPTASWFDIAQYD